MTKLDQRQIETDRIVNETADDMEDTSVVYAVRNQAGFTFEIFRHKEHAQIWAEKIHGVVVPHSIIEKMQC